MSARRDPVEEWREVSAQAAAGGYRARARTVGRGMVGRSIGVVAFAVVALVAGLLVRALPTTGPAATPGGPVTASVEDANFRLTLTTPHGTYGPDDPIESVASVTYLGPKASETMYHAMRPMGFQIEEVDSKRAMGGGMDQPCLRTAVANGQSVSLPFEKAGAIADDPATGFDRAWYEDPVLRLPTGTWRIVAYLDVALGDCGGESHKLTVDNVIRVVDGATSSPTPAPSSPTAPASLSADAETALEIVRKYEDAFATDHAEQAWPLLSRWSKTVTGSSATFADAEHRWRATAGSPVIADPSRDPALLDPAFLGERAADIAASADLGRAYVVSVRRPEVDGAAAATENLVVAPTADGWRIWIDATAGRYGMWSYPDGCAAFELSPRRCDAVVDVAADNISYDRANASSVLLASDPGCGSDPLTDEIVLCTRSLSFVAGVVFESADGTSVRSDVFCGPGAPTLVCSDTPGIQIVDLHSGYWDVPCAGEAPDGCATPVPFPTGAAADVGRELRIASVDVPVGPIGHHEVVLGTAVLVNGIAQEGTFTVNDQLQDGFLLDPGIVRLELRSTIAGRPPFDNIYSRGTFDGPEEVRVFLVFDVAEASDSAVLHVQNVLVK